MEKKMAIQKRKRIPKCSICGGDLYTIMEEVIFGWIYGHNAWPIVDEGRCCSLCNDTKVVPARIARYYASRKEKS